MDEIGQKLAAAGLTEETLRELFAKAPNPAAARIALERSGDPRAAIIRLFALGDEVAASELAFEAGELVERDGDMLRPLVRVTPYRGLLIVHDPDGRDPELVGGVTNAARTLATLTVRRPVERALDVGTGGGVHALLAARHAQNIVATDVSERALRYAALNARLNGVELDLREGSWFEPVAGEAFDLIVCNPPYVISPDTEYVFRDSGLAGDDASRAVVRGAAEHLREGGYATLMCNWICRDANETWQPLAEWVAGTGCDALLLAHKPLDPLEYAARWNEPLQNTPEYGKAVERWLDSYDKAGVHAIGFGAVVLRRRSGENWCRGFDLEIPSTGNAGEHLLRLFAAADEPLGEDDDVELVPGHRLEQRLIYRDGYELNDIVMLLDDGVGLVGRVPAEALEALFDGTLGRHPVAKSLHERGFVTRKGVVQAP